MPGPKQGSNRAPAAHVQAALERSGVARVAQREPRETSPGRRPLAAHVQAAIQSGQAQGEAQPKAEAPAPGARPLAPHVQAALAAGSVQARKAPATQSPAAPKPPNPPMGGRQAPRSHDTFLPEPGSIQPRRPESATQPTAEPGVIQPGRFKSVTADQDFDVSHTQSGNKFYLRVKAHGGSSDELANMRYKLYPDKTAVMEHVEAYGMPSGTRTGYLLFYLFAKHAKKEGMTHVAIGTGVDESSVKRNIELAREREDEGALKEAKRNMAAVHIYKELGFDASDAVRLSNSLVSVDDVISTCVAKLKNRWLEWVGKQSKCFLTTACVAARGLPDDCEELSTLRAFRDDYLATTSEGRRLVEEYYRIAPGLVEAISARPDREALHEGIYRVVRRCMAAIRAGEPESALDDYRRMVTDLTRRLQGEPLGEASAGTR